MPLYGLTGGIGSGKTTVAAMFARPGIATFDADAVGKQLLAGSLGARVLRAFPACATAAGGVDRRRLAALVFADASARARLEQLMHPAIWHEIQARVSRLPAQTRCVLVEGAVLLESAAGFALNGLIVVTAPLAVRIARLQSRGDLDDEQARARIAAQSPEHRKVLAATYLIDNGADPRQTREQVEAVVGLLLRECGGKS